MQNSQTATLYWKLRRAINRVFLPARVGEGLRANARRWTADLGARDSGWKSGEDDETVPLTTHRNTCVFRWNHSSRGPVVVRAWPYTAPPRHMRHHIEAGRLLAEAGLRVPGILLCDVSARARLRFRIEAVIEEFAPGSHPGTMSSFDTALLARLASELTRLHTTTRGTWAQAERGWDRVYDRTVRATVRYGAGGLSQDELARVLKRLDAARGGVDFGKACLVHGDVNPGNLLVDAAGSITWIDFQSVHFGHAQEDLLGVRRWLEPLGQYDEFLGLYRGALRSAGIDSAENPTLELLLALDKLVMHARCLAEEGMRRQPAPWDEKRRSCLSLVRRLLTER